MQNQLNYLKEVPHWIVDTLIQFAADLVLVVTAPLLLLINLLKFLSKRLDMGCCGDTNEDVDTNPEELDESTHSLTHSFTHSLIIYL